MSLQHGLFTVFERYNIVFYFHEYEIYRLREISKDVNFILTNQLNLLKLHSIKHWKRIKREYIEQVSTHKKKRDKLHKHEQDLLDNKLASEFSSLIIKLLSCNSRYSGENYHMHEIDETILKAYQQSIYKLFLNGASTTQFTLSSYGIDTDMDQYIKNLNPKNVCCTLLALYYSAIQTHSNNENGSAAVSFDDIDYRKTYKVLLNIYKIIIYCDFVPKIFLNCMGTVSYHGRWTDYWHDNNIIHWLIACLSSTLIPYQIGLFMYKLLEHIIICSVDDNSYGDILWTNIINHYDHFFLPIDSNEMYGTRVFQMEFSSNALLYTHKYDETWSENVMYTQRFSDELETFWKTECVEWRKMNRLAMRSLQKKVIRLFEWKWKDIHFESDDKISITHMIYAKRYDVLKTLLQETNLIFSGFFSDPFVSKNYCGFLASKSRRKEFKHIFLKNDIIRNKLLYPSNYSNGKFETESLLFVLLKKKERKLIQYIFKMEKDNIDKLLTLTDKNGNNALLFICGIRGKTEKIIRFLIKMGADISVRNNANETIFDRAKQISNVFGLQMQ
eukprot:402047_1